MQFQHEITASNGQAVGFGRFVSTPSASYRELLRVPDKIMQPGRNMDEVFF
jgi:hypothetical protein